MSEGLPLLSTRINQARQLTQSLRGRGLAPETADEIAGRLKEAARLLQDSFARGRKAKAADRNAALSLVAERPALLMVRAHDFHQRPP
jgi:hypothetical protein